MPHYPPGPSTRREFLTRCGMGMGSLALGSLLSEQAQAAGSPLNPLTPKQPHFPARAKRVIHLFMNGGPSQVDTFDPKPELTKYARQDRSRSRPAHRTPDRRRPRIALQLPASTARAASRSASCSPTSREHVDDLCVIRSMHADVPNHEPSLLLMNCGDGPPGRAPASAPGSPTASAPRTRTCPASSPCARAATRSRNPRTGRPASSPASTRAPTSTPSTPRSSKLIENIQQHARPAAASSAASSTSLQQLNRRHPQAPPGRRRTRSPHPVVRTRLPHADATPTDAFDIDREPAAHPRRCTATASTAARRLIARRLVERGVRFVQLWHGAGQPWDNHDDIETNHRRLAGECDQAIAALLTDLKQRGMLDDTLVIWGGEFGRTPTVELPTPGSNAGEDQRPRPQPLRLHHVAGRRRRQRRPRPRRHRRVRLQRRREPSPRPRPARHHPAPARLRPRDASPTATPAATSA